MAYNFVGNRLDDSKRSVQSLEGRNNSLTSGHRACQGCGEALGARVALDAAYKETDGKIVVVNATGCLEVFSCIYPENSWNVPWVHSLFGNAPAIATGVAAGFHTKGEHDVRVIAQGGDGSTADIGFASLSGMFERNDDVLYICYDNQAYMNTGVQRSGATIPLTRTATTMPVSGYNGSEIHTGKDMPSLALAHNIPYVATASVADLKDIESKVRKAIHIRGARYLHLHVPCPLGWGYDPQYTIELSRNAVESGLFPVYEYVDGQLTKVKKIKDKLPVEEYLKTQRRFAHLFKGGKPRQELIDHIQKIADHNIAKYGLMGE